MKQSIRFAALVFAAMAVVFSGCKKEEVDGTVTLRSLAIVNGGLAGTERYEGAVDTENKSVPEVYIVSSLCGGTGSALFLPIALFIKRYFQVSKFETC